MSRSTMSGYLERTVDRRRFFRYATAAAVAAGTGGIFPPRAAAEGHRSDIVAVFYLDPEFGASDPACPADEEQRTGSCHACNACHEHGRNKLFSSAIVADSTRAHRHCRCLVGATQIDTLTAVAIFGPPQGPMHRDEFDRRRDELFLPAAAPPVGAS